MNDTRNVEETLQNAGCAFVRQGKGDHDITRSPITKTAFHVGQRDCASVLGKLRVHAGRVAQAILNGSASSRSKNTVWYGTPLEILVLNRVFTA